MTLQKKFAAFVTAVLWSFGAAAHEGHDHEVVLITTSEAETRAKEEIARLADSGKIDSSWKTAAKVETSGLKGEGKKQEWALTFSNPNVTDATKKTLYVFLTPTGKYVAANFTGR